MARWVVALLTIWLIGLASVIADLAASAPKARTYGPRGYVISVGGVKMKKPRWVRRQRDKTKALTPGQAAHNWEPVASRATLMDLERANVGNR